MTQIQSSRTIEPPPSPPSAEKRCPRCQKTLPVTAFNLDPKRASGRMSLCGRCRGKKRLDNRGGRITECVLCGGRIPAERIGTTSTCCRDCLCLSVGLSPDFQLRDLERATETEIRDVLDSIILAASIGARR